MTQIGGLALLPEPLQAGAKVIELGEKEKITARESNANKGLWNYAAEVLEQIGNMNQRKSDSRRLLMTLERG